MSAGGSLESSERRAPRLWVFNLDAELELEQGLGYQTSQRMARTLEPVLPEARKLMAPGDASLDLVEAGAGAHAGWVGATWCPTPTALARLARAGAALEPSPSFDVLRRVNHRGFYLELGGGAPGARYVRDASDLGATLAEKRVWLIKRPFGFAGRGQRRISGEPTPDDWRWLTAGLRQGGFLAEHWVAIEREVGVHGVVDARGQLSLGRICVQETNEQRCWVSTRRAEPKDLSADHTAALLRRAESVAQALWNTGYFGPFGIDAYLWRTAGGSLELNALGELNARHTMGFAVGEPGSPG